MVSKVDGDVATELGHWQGRDITQLMEIELIERHLLDAERRRSDTTEHCQCHSVTKTPWCSSHKMAQYLI